MLRRRSKNSIAIFSYKQQLLSIDMKTKVVQHVPRIKISIWPLVCDMWNMTCDRLDSMTNNHFWAYTWKQKLFRTTTGCQKDRKTCRKTDWQKDKTTFQFRCQNKSCSLHFTCTAPLKPSVLGISECQQDARKIERQADRQTDRQKDFSA